MKKKVLLIDDEQSLRRTVSLSLMQSGFDTIPCENGINALKRLELYMKSGRPPACVVIDIKLPDIDGIRLFKIIKFKYPSLPVILITGYTDIINKDEVKKMDIAAYFEKPLDMNTLREKFSEIIEKNKSVEEKDEEALVSKSAYMLIKVDKKADYFKIYKKLYFNKNIVYCDATKGDYNMFLLIQGECDEDCENFYKETLNNFSGIKDADFLMVEKPVLEESTRLLIESSEKALYGENNINQKRDFKKSVNSYLVLDIEREKLDYIYPTLCLDENVIHCDYTTGKYNLVLFVQTRSFNEVDALIEDKITTLDGILKVKEYPIVNFLNM